MPRRLSPLLVPQVSSPRRSSHAPSSPHSFPLHISPDPPTRAPFLPHGFLFLGSDGGISLLSRFYPFPWPPSYAFPALTLLYWTEVRRRPGWTQAWGPRGAEAPPSLRMPRFSRPLEAEWEGYWSPGAPPRIGSSFYPTQTHSRLPPLAWKDPPRVAGSCLTWSSPDSVSARGASPSSSVCSTSGSRSSLWGELRPDLL